MWDMIKMSYIHLTGILKESVERMRLRQSIFERKKKKRMAVYFTNLKNAKPTDSRTSVSPSWDNFKKNRTRHIAV